MEPKIYDIVHFLNIPTDCRSTRNVRNVTKVSPVLKQIINKRKEETPQSSCDSVEHSFKEKLSLQSRRQDKEEKELEVFEMLEGATLNSSFSRSDNDIILPNK